MNLTKRQLIQILEYSDLDYLPETEIYAQDGNLMINDKIIFTNDEINQKVLQTMNLK